MRNPGISQAEIAERTEAPKQTVSYNVKKLVEYDIVEVKTETNKTGCYILTTDDGPDEL
jgi:DNA-binding MarR family transcriptional regulator